MKLFIPTLARSYLALHIWKKHPGIWWGFAYRSEQTGHSNPAGRKSRSSRKKTNRLKSGIGVFLETTRIMKKCLCASFGYSDLTKNAIRKHWYSLEAYLSVPPNKQKICCCCARTVMKKWDGMMLQSALQFVVRDFPIHGKGICGDLGKK